MGKRAQRPRARQLWLTPEEGEPSRAPVAEVALRVPTHRTVYCAVPDALKEAVRPGAWVTVARHNKGREQVGFCVRILAGGWDHSLPRVIAAEPPQFELPPSLVELGLWISEYYVCPPGRTFAAMLPSAVRAAKRPTVQYVQTAGDAPSKLTPRQAAVWSVLGGGPRPLRETLEIAGVGRSVLQRMVQAGVLSISRREVDAAADRGPAIRAATPEDDYALTADQSQALATVMARIDAGRFAPMLLFGVPGSGKTEVYVRAIRHARTQGRQALLLIPEIALATQIVERLALRLDHVAVLHGQMTAAARARTLRQIAIGDVQVVIGTRTAVFAPFSRLGLIVVDEEQESSFKSLSAPYFHARDVALKRGQIEGIAVLLGSATPALESWHNASIDRRYERLTLSQRIPGAELPRTELAVAESEPLGRPSAAESADRSVLSSLLHRRLVEVLAAKRQAILLHNRRGYATGLRCRSCGLALRCPHCLSFLVWHQPDESLRCHRCGVRQPVPSACGNADCRGALAPAGLAIQKLEQELAAAFPAARLLRLDSDTMRHREDYARTLQAFERREADILIGTQMVAKGLDFPDVELVGVIDADMALYLPDFRAAEITFQLLMQVVGRAGRRAGASLAVVQVRDEPPAVIRDALRADYPAFAARELEVRRRYGFPPTTRLARLVLADSRIEQVAMEAQRIGSSLDAMARQVHPNITVDAAEHCLVPRIRDLNRWQLLLRCPREIGLQALLRRAIAEKLLPPRVERFTIDVDPLDLS